MDNRLKDECTFTVTSNYSGHVNTMTIDARLALMRNVILDINDKTKSFIESFESDLNSKSREIERLQEHNKRLSYELSAVKDSYMYFNIANEMDVEERIKYQQQFIQQEIEIANLRESNKQLQSILDKYRQQNTAEFMELQQKNRKSMMEAMGFMSSEDDDID
jgi:hypothetical protein